MSFLLSSALAHGLESHHGNNWLRDPAKQQSKNKKNDGYLNHKHLLTPWSLFGSRCSRQRF